MNKALPMVVSLLVFLPLCSYAKQEMDMRTMAVEQLSKYGRAIYDRGDYQEATHVFTRVLAMDPNNESARDYAQKLNKKGQNIVIPARIEPPAVAKPPVANKDRRAKKVKILQKQEFSKVQPAPKTDPLKVEISKQEIPLAQEDLKHNIQRADADIETMKNDIAGLRAQIKDQTP